MNVHFLIRNMMSIEKLDVLSSLHGPNLRLTAILLKIILSEGYLMYLI